MANTYGLILKTQGTNVSYSRTMLTSGRNRLALSNNGITSTHLLGGEHSEEDSRPSALQNLSPPHRVRGGRCQTVLQRGKENYLNHWETSYHSKNNHFECLKMDKNFQEVGQKWET